MEYLSISYGLAFGRDSFSSQLSFKDLTLVLPKGNTDKAWQTSQHNQQLGKLLDRHIPWLHSYVSLTFSLPN